MIRRNRRECHDFHEQGGWHRGSRSHEVYRLTYPDGTKVEFDYGNGAFQSQTNPGGTVIQVTGYLANGFNLAQVERSYSANGHTTTEQLHYEYSDSSGDQLLSTVTLRRKLDAGAWTNVNRATYTYYGYQEDHGGEEDLKTVITQIWDGSAWQSTGTSYYRYYPWFLASGSSSSSSSSGGSGSTINPLNHLLKYVVQPATYDRIVAAGFNPLTATDATIAQFADFYFEYDDERRVTREDVHSASQTYRFEYAESEFADGYNSWRRKTTETLPDGSQNVIYTNFAGQTMLSVFQSGDEQWCNFYRYDDSAHIILQANPSAVTGFDEAHADLLNFDAGSGTFEFLKDNEGLIHTNTYHEPSGFVASENLQKGQLGDSIPLNAYEYCCCNDDCSCGGISEKTKGSGLFVVDGVTIRDVMHIKES